MMMNEIIPRYCSCNCNCNADTVSYSGLQKSIQHSVRYPPRTWLSTFTQPIIVNPIYNMKHRINALFQWGTVAERSYSHLVQPSTGYQFRRPVQRNDLGSATLRWEIDRALILERHLKIYRMSTEANTFGEIFKNRLGFVRPAAWIYCRLF